MAGSTRSGKRDVSEIDPPADLLYDDRPDETIYFDEINSCGILYRTITPFPPSSGSAMVLCPGQDRNAGLHSAERNEAVHQGQIVALSTAKAHIE
jgi:hypothetical protein